MSMWNIPLRIHRTDNTMIINKYRWLNLSTMPKMDWTTLTYFHRFHEFDIQILDLSGNLAVNALRLHESIDRGIEKNIWQKMYTITLSTKYERDLRWIDAIKMDRHVIKLHDIIPDWFYIGMQRLVTILYRPAVFVNWNAVPCRLFRPYQLNERVPSSSERANKCQWEIFGSRRPANN